jgi:hypothetical protein
MSHIAVWRFFNFAKDRYGEPFGLCAKHEKQYVETSPPRAITSGDCRLEKVADDGHLPCNFCGEKES